MQVGLRWGIQLFGKQIFLSFLLKNCIFFRFLPLNKNNLSKNDL